MEQIIKVEFLWIPKKFGGHTAAPWLGMRLQIRWLKHIQNSLELSRGISCISLEYSEVNREGIATFTFFGETPIPVEWLQDGELIELINAYFVLGVGKIVVD